MVKHNRLGQTFCAWLRESGHEERWILDLVELIRADPEEPHEGVPQDVRNRLIEIAAETEMFNAVDQAEAAWLAAGAAPLGRIPKP